jgi:tetratricopeptide (TPR) repeat protein
MNFTNRITAFFLLTLTTVGLICCTGSTSHEKMISVLKTIDTQNKVRDNFFYPEGKVNYFDSLVLASTQEDKIITNNYLKGFYLLPTGEPEQVIEIYKNLLSRMEPDNKQAIQLVNQYLGVAYMRLGEQVNCIANPTSESCIFPIQGKGIHQDNQGSKNAITYFETVLQSAPDDLETRWLLNIAYMTLGLYPQEVPREFLIPGLETQTAVGIKPFREISGELGFDDREMSGGAIIEDFDLDGDLDLVTSAWGLAEPMHFWMNNGDGTFKNHSEKSKLNQLTGGLNIMQTDYNNDGYPDIFVLRGGWMGKFGRQPNSLIRNNGDGTFTDVTFDSGLLSYIPTQAATWNDFNNDGWLDVFIGNESSMQDIYPCELYLNQKDGTFKNVAYAAGIDIIDYAKAVTSGDYDNDGWPDIFISTMNRKSYLFRNRGAENGIMKFEDVTAGAGLGNQISKTFPTWFWDYDNDGWLDIFLCAYEFDKSLGYYEAAEKLNLPMPEESKMKLYRNNRDGTFTNIADKVGLDRVANAMGSNFGDIDNDGYLDFYLGTGNPDMKSIIPNRLFKNARGQSFEDITTAARVGNLQKGHGVAFADLDFDGDQDIFIQVGGSFKGDQNKNSLYMNPGQSENNWVAIKLEGAKSNRLAIGSRIKVTFQENGKERHVYRDINSGGSFGSSPLLAHIGIGTATLIDRIEIQWSGSSLKQEFTNVMPNQGIHVKEAISEYEILTLKQVNFLKEPLVIN